MDPAAATPLWAPGSWASVGSWPGTQPHEAARVIVGETPHLPALPELPARGAGADMVGRTLALLPDLPAAVVPSGWRFLAAPGSDMRRSLAWLRQDLDAFEEAAHDLTSPAKIQLAGPFTLAASVELASGERVVSDHGARRDVVAAFVEAAATHVSEVRRRLPQAHQVLLQVDEPALTGVLSGTVPTASGYRTYRSVSEQEVAAGLAAVVAAVHGSGGSVAFHSCATTPPLALLIGAQPDAVSLPMSALTSDTYDTLGSAIDGGTRLLLGVVSTSAIIGSSSLLAQVASVRRWWSELGFPGADLARLAITPTCGLAGASPTVARDIVARCRDIATAVLEDPDGDHHTDA